MTVPTLESVAEFSTNGVTTNFPFFFKFLANEDLVVTYVSPLGVSSVLTLGAQYTVNGAGDDDGGSIVTTSALAGPGQLVVAREMDAYQQTSLRNQGKFLAETHEDVFDRLTMLIQQNIGSLSRALSRPYGMDSFYGEGRRITDVADPTGNMDVANKQFVESYVTGIIEGGQGPQNNAFNVLYSDGNSVGQIIRDKLITVVNSITALRSVLKTQYTHCFVSGYEPGTAGGGHYEYDATDTTSADNGGTIIVATDGGRWKLKYQQFVTVEQFGALPIPGRNNFTRLQAAVAACWAAKVKLCAGTGTFEYGTTLDLSYPGLDISGAGYRQTVFKFTGSGRAMDALGTRPNNGTYSIGLTLRDFTIEGNVNVSDLLRLRINHSRLVNINARLASPVFGCGFRIEGSVAGSFDNLICSTGDALMSSRPANGLVIDADPTDGRRATCNTFVNMVIEGMTGDGVRLVACDAAIFVGGTSENHDGVGLSVLAGCQMNTFTGVDCESNRGYADILDGGECSTYIGCGTTKNFYIDNSARMTKVEGGWHDKFEIGVGAALPKLSRVKVRFFGGAVGLTSNNNPTLSISEMYDVTAGAFVFPAKQVTTITVTTGVFTYTNANSFDEWVTVFGGTLSSLNLNRGAIAGVAPLPLSGMFHLEPGDGLTFNSSVAPTVRRVPGRV